MRRRILQTSLVLSLALIGTMTVMMVLGYWFSTRTSHMQRLETQADQVAVRVHDEFHDGGVVTEAEWKFIVKRLDG